MKLDAGHRLGPCQILAPLGAGGTGEVYRAKDTRLEREGAIKVLPGRLAENPEALTRFEREVKAVAVLCHRGVQATPRQTRRSGSKPAPDGPRKAETLRASGAIQ